MGKLRIFFGYLLNKVRGLFRQIKLNIFNIITLFVVVGVGIIFAEVQNEYEHDKKRNPD